MGQPTRSVLAFVALLSVGATSLFTTTGCVNAVLNKLPFGSSSPPKLPETKPRAPRPPPPAEWFWEPIDIEVHAPSRKPTELSVNSEIARIEGAGRVWDDLPQEARERFKKEGALVVSDAKWAQDPPSLSSMGAFYTRLRDERIPHLITMDALFAVVHLGLERALAEVEEMELVPLLTTVLEKLDTRLRAEGSASLGTELAEGYRVARGVISVARALAASTYAPSPDLAAAVTQEKANVEGHAGIALSPILSQSIDYAQFAVPSTTAHPSAYRALAYLSAAPLTLVGRGEAPGAQLSVGQARMNARAAMLLARVCARDVDAPLHTAYEKLLRLLAFVWGPPDDLSLIEIDQLATSAGVDLTKPDNISNVTRVDKLRARASAGRAPSAFDGSSSGVGRAGISARVFGGHAAADSLVLQSLVGAPVGLAQESAAAAPVDRLRQGRRVLPSTLDIPAWLGIKEARTALRESHADAFDGYEAALVSLQRTRPAEGSALHASIYGSLIDALIAWATVQSPPNPIRLTPAAERARTESILAAWTLVRHSGQALSRRSPVPINAPELRVTGAALPVFVEPLPESIARLRGTMKQIRRGLSEVGGLKSETPTMNLLLEIEEMLKAAQRGAERHASDEAPTNEESAALASLPARMARVEAECGGSDAVGPVVAVVHSDPASHRVLASATGNIEPILMLARAPSKDELILVVGAHQSHYELVVETTKIPTDATWRARLKTTKDAPDRAGWASTFRYSAAPPIQAPSEVPPRPRPRK